MEPESRREVGDIHGCFRIGQVGGDHLVDKLGRLVVEQLNALHAHVPSIARASPDLTLANTVQAHVGHCILASPLIYGYQTLYFTTECGLLKA